MENSELPIAKPLKFAELRGGALDLRISPNSEQLKKLAARYELLAVRSFSAALNVAVWRKTGVEVRGVLDSQIVQACVATLAPVDNAIHVEFCTRLVPASEFRKYREKLESEGAIEVELDEIEPPEEFNGTDIDLGEIAAERFALSIDPFPRAENADFEAFLAESVDSEFVNSRPPSAFAELAGLQRKLK